MDINNNGIFRKPANYYEDQPPIQISHVPEVDLAYISNDKVTFNQITTYIFDTIHLSYSDFKTCFFDSILENFNISLSNYDVQALSLHQNYIDTTKKRQPFQLNSAVLYAWSEKNKAPIVTIPIDQKILLNKNTLMTRSIGSFHDVQNALSWNEAIQSLIETGEIIPAKKDKLSCAVIDFKIYVYYNYNPLEITINMQFTYRIHVPGYRNKPEPNPCYSSDLSLPRKEFQFTNYEDDKKSHNTASTDDNSSTGSDKGESSLERHSLNPNFQEYDCDNCNPHEDSNTLRDEVDSLIDTIAESAEQNW